MNNDSQGVVLGGSTNIVGPNPNNVNNNEAGVTPNVANAPVIPVVPIIGGNAQIQPDSGQITPMNDLANPVAENNIPVVNDNNSGQIQPVSMDNQSSSIPSQPSPNQGNSSSNGGIITVVPDSNNLAITSNNVVSDQSVVASAINTPLNFDLPNNEIPATSTDNNNSFNSYANDGVISVTPDSIVGEQKNSNNSGTVSNTEVIATPTVSNGNDATGQMNSSNSPEVANTGGATAPTNPQPNNQVSNSSDSVSFGQYLGHMFLFVIPVIGQIVLILKAFNKKETKIKNFAKAFLVFLIIMVAIVVGVTFFMTKFTDFSICNNSEPVDEVYSYE